MTEVALRWGDMDALGHVNNAVTVTLLEEGRVRFLRSLAQDVMAQSFGLIAARHEIDYVTPLLYTQDPVHLRVWIDRIGNSSFTVACEVDDPAGVLAVKARTVLVALSPDGSGSMRLPDHVRELFARFLLG